MSIAISQPSITDMGNSMAARIAPAGSLSSAKRICLLCILSLPPNGTMTKMLTFLQLIFVLKAARVFGGAVRKAIAGKQRLITGTGGKAALIASARYMCVFV